MKLYSSLLFFIVVSIANITSGSAANYYKFQSSPSTLSTYERGISFFKLRRKSMGWKDVSIKPTAIVPLKKSTIAVYWQTVNGMRVVGKTIKVEIDHNGKVLRTFGNAVSGLSIKKQKYVEPATAIMAVEDIFNAILPLDMKTELVVLADRINPVVAYEINVNEGFRLWKVYVNAVTGKVIRKQKGWFDAYGRVYLIDPARTPDATDVELLNLTTDATYLDGYDGLFKIYNCVTAPTLGGTFGGGQPDVENATLEIIPTSDASGNYIYEPVLGVDYTELAGAVNLYYHVDLMYTHFQELSYTAPNYMNVVSNLHTENSGSPVPFDNAYFTPSSDGTYDIITAGQGTNIDLAYGGDVIMHEFTHSVIFHTAIGLDAPTFDQYGINRMPNGIHEGLADYFPSSLNDTPVMGAWALEEMQAGASRDLSNNNKVCPDDMIGEEHADGELIGSVSWAIRQYLGGGKDLADPIIFDAMAKLTSQATFKDYHEALVQTLSDAVTAGTITQAQMDGALELSVAKGLDICGRYIPLDTPRQNTVYGLDQLAQSMGGTCNDLRGYLSGSNATMPTLFQYVLNIPEGTTKLTFNIDFTVLTSGNDLLFNVYGRASEMNQYELVPLMGGFEVPRMSQFDKQWPAGNGAHFTADSTEFTWTIYDNPPLPVGQDVYFAVTNTNCPTTSMVVNATLSNEEIEDPDAGTDAENDAENDAETDTGNNTGGGGSDGCKCSSPAASHSGSTGWLLLLIPAIFLGIIRRKQLA